MVKKLAKQIIGSMGFELSRFSESEKKVAEEFEWDLELFAYKDFQVARGIAYSGLMTVDEARFLSTLVQRTSEEDPIIEIGTLFGFSTMVVTINKSKAQKLITVDNYSWNPHNISPVAHKLATASRLQDASSNHNVEILNKSKNDFYNEYSGPIPGLFFCDANHEYESTLDDLRWARQVGAKIICGHDYKSKFPGVKKAVKEFGGPSELVGSLFVL
ncbi:class I SAM-dependent methyltransferase [Aliifodinibius salicampi]|uniref:Class I SAM-dependent methyltransferase n=1 Tax=Fodinibius salicampi TaxID=1920655 RepID=A0ABT3PV63_9BACT|nr:class I SAM-dependent methyltransferase [Fodinibius salicampi]MCW9711745.1 class I SAM-dependent methyltransferase [Fodinibius salicampi]